MKSLSFIFLLGVALVNAPATAATEVVVTPDLLYKTGALTPEEIEACRLDLYLPPDARDFPTFVWLHGGGFTGGSKSTALGQRFARRLAEAGVAVAMVEYRLNPVVQFPAYIEDAAAAFAWVRTHIHTHGGDGTRVFLGGHSAGAYQALMVALDDRYLSAHGLDQRAVAGIIAISGQTTTHFTVRAERGLGERIVVDDAAPLYHVQPRTFPILLYAATDDMPLRVEEMRLLAGALRAAKCQNVSEHIWPDRTHSTVFSDMSKPGDPIANAIIAWVRQQTN